MVVLVIVVRVVVVLRFLDSFHMSGSTSSGIPDYGPGPGWGPYGPIWALMFFEKGYVSGSDGSV